jgi:hypothetical protein
MNLGYDIIGLHHIESIMEGPDILCNDKFNIKLVVDATYYVRQCSAATALSKVCSP